MRWNPHLLLGQFSNRYTLDSPDISYLLASAGLNAEYTLMRYPRLELFSIIGTHINHSRGLIAGGTEAFQSNFFNYTYGSVNVGLGLRYSTKNIKTAYEFVPFFLHLGFPNYLRVNAFALSIDLRLER